MKNRFGHPVDNLEEVKSSHSTKNSEFDLNFELTLDRLSAGLSSPAQVNTTGGLSPDVQGYTTGGLSSLDAQGYTTGGLSSPAQVNTTGELSSNVQGYTINGLPALTLAYSTEVFQAQEIKLLEEYQQKYYSFVRNSLLVAIIITLLAISIVVFTWLQFNESLKLSKESINLWIWIILLTVICALVSSNFAILKDHLRRKNCRSNAYESVSYSGILPKMS